MGTRTISLENSAYDKLKAAKRPGESFSDVINRVLGGREPSLLDLQGLLNREGAERLAAAIARMRKEDLDMGRRRTRIRR